MSCENQDHVGCIDAGIQPRFRCLYCGAWGYAPSWTDEEADSYENCDCEHPYQVHLESCIDVT